ncbi:MAG: hypothetical protein ACRDPO_12650, partial [Streptosporangiaceae bacterium]
AVSEAAADGQPHELAVAELVAYLAEEILPHALAEEQTIYRGLHWPAWVTNTIVLAGEHKELTTAAGRLADLPGGTAGRRS